MDDRTVKHIQLITNTIDRLARNSFQLKAWAVILVAAIFALGTKEVDWRFYLIGLVPGVAFWGLDGYYLWQERLFRKLYDKVRNGEHDAERYGPFSMNTRTYQDEVAIWLRVCLSRTILGFYLPLVIAVVAASVVALAVVTAE